MRSSHKGAQLSSNEIGDIVNVVQERHLFRLDVDADDKVASSPKSDKLEDDDEGSAAWPSASAGVGADANSYMIFEKNAESSAP